MSDDVCWKHKATRPCPHCAEDEKVLEERIEAVGLATKALMVAIYEATTVERGVDDRDPKTVLLNIRMASEAHRDALRSLVREIRR